MNEELRTELETRVQNLLAGELSQAETAELLDRITRDDDARRVLCETIDLQRKSRKLFGCDVSDDVVRKSLARTMAALNAERGYTEPPAEPRGQAQPHWPVRWPVWLTRIAAMIVVAACVYVAMTARHDSLLLREQLAGTEQSVALPQPTAQELACLRQVWAYVSDSGKSVVPWVCLSDGVGAFGHAPVAQARAGAKGLILLDCVIIRADGLEAKHIRVLVPPDPGVEFAVPEAGWLAGQPIQLVVSSSDGREGVDLTIGTEASGLAGVKGRTLVGMGGVEVGQFRVDGQKMRVFLRAVRLSERMT